MRIEREKQREREQECVREIASEREIKRDDSAFIRLKLGMTGRERNKIVSYRLRESEKEKERNQL